MKIKNKNHFKPIVNVRISRFLLRKIDELAKEKKIIYNQRHDKNIYRPIIWNENGFLNRELSFQKLLADNQAALNYIELQADG